MPCARAAGEGSVTQPPSARLPGTLQQLEPPLLQEPKAFVPQCQGCPGRREAGRLPLPGETQAQPHCPEGFQASRTSRIRGSSLPLARQSQVSSNSRGPLARSPPNSDPER